MPRNASGTYTLPLPSVISNTIIESVWANTSLDDIAQSLTDSLSRTGQGGMTAPLRFVDGAVGAPGFAWQAETGTGFYRESTGVMSVAVQGVKLGQWSSTGFALSTGKTLTLPDVPSAATDAANKQYVDTVVAGGVAVSSGTYTPTCVNQSNINASTPSAAQWMRVGNTVTVSGVVFIDYFAGGLASTTLRMSLPVPSNFTATGQCAGTASAGVRTDVPASSISADPTNDAALLNTWAPDNQSASYWYIYAYTVA
jgi:hypothetical protein